MEVGVVLFGGCLGLTSRRLLEGRKDAVQQRRGVVLFLVLLQLVVCGGD